MYEVIVFKQNGSIVPVTWLNQGDCDLERAIEVFDKQKKGDYESIELWRKDEGVMAELIRKEG